MAANFTLDAKLTDWVRALLFHRRSIFDKSGLSAAAAQDHRVALSVATPEALGVLKPTGITDPSRLNRFQGRIAAPSILRDLVP